MPCEVYVDAAVQSDILDCDRAARQEIYNFLLELQQFPLPPGCHESMSMGAYFHRLRCGYFISWEVLGTARSLIRMTLGHDTQGITVRLLGCGRTPPGSRP